MTIKVPDVPATGPQDVDVWLHLASLLKQEKIAIGWQLERLGFAVTKPGRPYHLAEKHRTFLKYEQARLDRIIRFCEEAKREFDELLKVQADGTS